MKRPILKDPENILLVRTDRIGDVILTTPAIGLLKQRYPRARLFFLTRAYTAPMLKHHDYLTETIVYDPQENHRGLGGHIKLARELKNRKIDLAILFFPQVWLVLTLKIAGIRRRIGTGYRWYSILLNERVFEHRKYGLHHELEYNLSLIKKEIGPAPPPREIKFGFRVDNRLKKLRQSVLEIKQIDRPYIIVHPGSGGSAPNLPPQQFAGILKHISEKSDFRVILVGSPNEEKLISEIAELASVPDILRSVGEWDLETYMAVISGSKLFVSNSTGPLHIARALSIPLLAFYCPAIPCSPKRWGPYNRQDSVITPNVEPCKTCNPKKCPHGVCLAKIEWKQIKAKLDILLHQI